MANLARSSQDIVVSAAAVLLVALLACDESHHPGPSQKQGPNPPSCPGVVEVTKGPLAGGGPGKALAASAFYSFGPRVVLASPECGGLLKGNGIGLPQGDTVGSIIRLYLPKGIGPGTYQFLPDGGSPFHAAYAAAGHNGSVFWGNGPYSGTLTLTTIDPARGIQGSYSLDFGTDGVIEPVGELIEEGTFAAPPCDLCGLVGSEAPDAGEPSFGTAELSACDHYYMAKYLSLGGPTLPASENARLLVRFEQVCRHQMTLPGSGVNAASLEACASDLDLSPGGYPASCNFYGSLPGDSSCADGIQCPSTHCLGTEIRYDTFGPVVPYTCGTCDPITAAVGQPCNSGRCLAGSECITSDPSASHPTYTCVAITYGGDGATCDDVSARCQPGFSCTAQRCRQLAAGGAPCGDATADGRGCIAPFKCSASGACRGSQSQDGGVCSSDSDCAPGLGCIPDGPCCNPPRICAPTTWAGPGEPCSETARCLVGTCDIGNFGHPSQAPDGGLIWSTCPTVIPDGQPCTAATFYSTCDTFAECFEGACILLDSVPCH
jgi:hypothetical protein